MMRVRVWYVCCVPSAFGITPPAFAHVTTLPVTPDGIWLAWSFEFWVVAPMLLVHWLYGRGVLKLWRSAGWGRGIGYRQAACFLGGEVLLVIALVSPLDPLGATLQSAHMAQHGILAAFAPPLLLLGRPDAAFAWALGPRLASALAQVKARLAFLAAPLVAAALHAAALWLWHLPLLYEAALENDMLHRLEHLSFFATGLLLWSALLKGAQRITAAPAAIAAGLATLILSGFLAALLTFAPQPFYAWYDGRAQLWGLTPLEDQQLAGLLMWVPMSPAYLAASLAAAFVLITHTSPDRNLRTAHRRQFSELAF